MQEDKQWSNTTGLTRIMRLRRSLASLLETIDGALCYAEELIEWRDACDTLGREPEQPHDADSTKGSTMRPDSICPPHGPDPKQTARFVVYADNCTHVRLQFFENLDDARSYAKQETWTTAKPHIVASVFSTFHPAGVREELSQ